MEKYTPEKEMAARQAGAGREAPPERVEEVLPELQLTELQKSENPINDVENRKLKIEAVRPWNNYTIVTLEGSDEIR